MKHSRKYLKMSDAFEGTIARRAYVHSVTESASN